MTDIQATTRALDQLGYDTDALYTPADYNDLIDSMTLLQRYDLDQAKQRLQAVSA